MAVLGFSAAHTTSRRFAALLGFSACQAIPTRSRTTRDSASILHPPEQRQQIPAMPDATLSTVSVRPAVLHDLAEIRL